MVNSICKKGNYIEEEKSLTFKLVNDEDLEEVMKWI